MAITNGYATLSEIKARLSISDSADDGVLEAVIEAASRQIDSFTSRQFFASNATKYYTPEDEYLLFIDDLISITSLKTITSNNGGTRTYGDTWSANDYDLIPFNSARTMRIAVNPGGRYTFPLQPKAVEIVGSWGYSSTTPDAINEACLIQASRLFKRKDAPFGILGVDEIGTQNVLPGLDPDVKRLLYSYQRLEIL